MLKDKDSMFVIRSGCSCDRTEIEQSVRDTKIYYEDKALWVNRTGNNVCSWIHLCT